METSDISKQLSDPIYITGLAAIFLIFVGFSALKSLKENSPLSPYVLQILGLTFILPIVLLITLLTKVEADAIMGLLGTIVGYIFGTSQITMANQKKDTQDTKNPSNP